jgi:sigma-B regulation protein RsbU (phosphoserine phosphatase)
VLEYANAGHNLPLIFREETKNIEKLSKGEIALGVVDDVKYENCRLDIGSGDTLLLYTDGVTEAFSSTGELFSESRLIDAVKDIPHHTAQQFLENLEDLIEVFRKGEPSSDDLTMIAIHRKK